MTTVVPPYDTAPTDSALPADKSLSASSVGRVRRGPRLPAAAQASTPARPGGGQGRTAGKDFVRAGEWAAHVIDTAPLDTGTVDTAPDWAVGQMPVELDSRAEQALTPYSEALLITCAFALRCTPLTEMDSERAQTLLEITLPLGHARVLRWRREVDPGQWQARWRKGVALTRAYYPNHTGAQRLPDELEQATEAGLLPAY